MKEVVINVKMISYFLNKLEAFLSKKQSSSSHGSTNENMQFCIDYELNTDTLNTNNLAEEEKNFDSDVESTDGEEGRSYTPRSEMSVVEDDEDEYYYTKTLFKDFSEPDVLKTGYLIPITCGHNG